ncbi:hypothetical protein PCNPT3_03585 [Psychromonas sp. CNPT3]|uniref:FeoC-like transcriptional regulator n=1 Tax=Psychromonas sp. CNPT3 TaxID=314282 RepID=UPI00006E42B8|nr:FeoC-like transcriptional regulator [Psychromonas sp. CNPT3]AGH80659.1 hypothetical protein PCNPT3_03585 [Psychromonas sp. CNPT3]
MILESIKQYVQQRERVSEACLLTHFHLSAQGLAPMMQVLLQRGKLYKTIHLQGDAGIQTIFYDYSPKKQIPIITTL